jgi:hypothetical protein
VTRTDKLQTILNDFRFLEDEKIAREEENRELRAMNGDLVKANDELKERLERMTNERDKIQAFAINLVTRLTVISENVANVIKEAGRAAISDAGRRQEQRRDAERVSAPRPPDQTAYAPAPQPRRLPIEQEPDDGLADMVRQLTQPPMNRL